MVMADEAPLERYLRDPEIEKIARALATIDDLDTVKAILDAFSWNQAKAIRAIMDKLQEIET